MSEQRRTPRVTVFSLGGTIASTNDDGAPGTTGATSGGGAGAAGGGVAPRLGAGELVRAIPQLREVAELETVTFRGVPSPDLTLDDLSELAAEIDRRFADGVDGVVVTQGTDTIEETAFALDLLVRARQPVVVTGAMRNPTLAGPDGSANLLAAVQVAVEPSAVDLGTVVVLNDEIHAARFVRKTHTSNPATFRSTTAGPLGWIVEGHPRIGLRPTPLRLDLPQRPDTFPAVALLTCALGDDLRLLGELARLRYAGLVIEAFGGGHVPGPAATALAELATGMPVVLASRTGGGELLRETYGFPGSERDLLAHGLIPAGFLDGPKARILLSLQLTADPDPAAVQAGFQRFLEASVWSGQGHGSAGRRG